MIDRYNSPENDISANLKPMHIKLCPPYQPVDRNTYPYIPSSSPFCCSIQCYPQSMMQSNPVRSGAIQICHRVPSTIRVFNTYLSSTLETLEHITSLYERRLYHLFAELKAWLKKHFRLRVLIRLRSFFIRPSKQWEVEQGTTLEAAILTCNVYTIYKASHHWQSEGN